MPTRVDAAAEATHREISSTVKHIKNNIKINTTTTSSPFKMMMLADQKNNPTHTHCTTKHTTNQLPSPLFRDEVQAQEMKYLDGLLGKKNDDDDSAQVDIQQLPSKQSRIASILSPYKSYTDDSNEVLEKQSSSFGGSSQQAYTYRSPQKQKQGATSLQHTCNKPIQNKNNSPLRNKFGGNISNVIHRCSSSLRSTTCSSTKGNAKQRRQNQSSNKKVRAHKRGGRQKMNYKVIQRAQRSLGIKLVKLGRRCTRGLTIIKHAIEQSVARALHSMLENGKTYSVVDLSNANNVASGNNSKRKTHTSAVDAAVENAKRYRGLGGGGIQNHR